MCCHEEKELCACVCISQYLSLSPISPGQAGEPGPGDITMLSNAISSYKYRQISLHVHSSLRTTTGGTVTVTQQKNVKTTIIPVSYLLTFKTQDSRIYKCRGKKLFYGISNIFPNFPVTFFSNKGEKKKQI